MILSILTREGACVRSKLNSVKRARNQGNLDFASFLASHNLIPRSPEYVRCPLFPAGYKVITGHNVFLVTLGAV